jgi:AcrR family transcriptional regulator
MSGRRRRDGEATRERILDEALALFRRRGYAETTMRDVAAAAGIALGGTYYYFPSKDAIVLAYYERLHDEHAARVHEALAGEQDTKARLRAVFHARLDLLRRDRKLLGALFHSIGDPDSRLSVFSPGSAELRRRSAALFEDALAGVPLPDDLRELAALAYWALLLAVLLYFIHDTSPRQERTRRLVDDAVDLTADLVPVLGSPFMAPARARLAKALASAGLTLGDAPRPRTEGERGSA